MPQNDHVGHVVSVNDDGTISIMLHGALSPGNVILSEEPPRRNLPRKRLKIVSDGTSQGTYILTMTEGGEEIRLLEGVTKCDIEIGTEDDIVKAHLEISQPVLDIRAQEGVRVVRRE